VSKKEIFPKKTIEVAIKQKETVLDCRRVEWKDLMKLQQILLIKVDLGFTKQEGNISIEFLAQ
jgi:hypothetical protein